MSIIGELGELALLERLRPHLAGDGEELVVGVGDDGAAWEPPPGELVVVTTDSLVEAVHFTTPLDAGGAADLGWRLLAVSLSDLAAMGARPGPAFLSLALPAEWPVAWVEDLYQGLAECAERFEVRIAGGNLTGAAVAVLTSTCLGGVPRGSLLRRAGARAGWQLAVTGALGAASASRRASVDGVAPESAWAAAARPVPRVAAGQALARAGVTVAIDVSDGVFTDAGHLLAAAEAAGLLLQLDALPLAPRLRERWPADWPTLAGGGEDYELMFAAPGSVMAVALTALQQLDLPVVVIGEFDGGRGLRLEREGVEAQPPAAGHQHFTAP